MRRGAGRGGRDAPCRRAPLDHASPLLPLIAVKAAKLRQSGKSVVAADGPRSVLRVTSPTTGRDRSATWRTSMTKRPSPAARRGFLAASVAAGAMTLASPHLAA